MNCISCSNSSLLQYTKDSYMNLAVYYCNNCNLYITGNSEVQVRERSQEVYRKSYWDERGSANALQSNYTDMDSKGKRRQWVSQYAYCKPFFENKCRMLEIGSGAGQTIVWFEEMGFNVTGIEPDNRNVEMINQKLKRGHCVVGFAEDIQIDGRFDIVWISHVIEHLVRPDKLLEKCKNNLENGGVLFIEVPNCENKKILKSSIYDNPSTFHFSKKALLNIAKKIGYEVVRIDFFRPPTLLEGGLNRIMKKYLNFIKNDLFPYYPKIITNNRYGTDIRLILKKH